MFTWGKTTPDDILIREKLHWKSLSGGTFIEIHIDSLLDEELVIHSDYVIDHENTIPAQSVISHVRKIQEEKIRKSGEKYNSNMVCFDANWHTYTVNELTFSMLLKRCFHTKKSTVCFSLRDADKPKNT